MRRVEQGRQIGAKSAFVTVLLRGYGYAHVVSSRYSRTYHPILAPTGQEAAVPSLLAPPKGVGLCRTSLS